MFHSDSKSLGKKSNFLFLNLNLISLHYNLIKVMAAGDVIGVGCLRIIYCFFFIFCCWMKRFRLMNEHGLKIQGAGYGILFHNSWVAGSCSRNVGYPFSCFWSISLQVFFLIFFGDLFNTPSLYITSCVYLCLNCFKGPF